MPSPFLAPHRDPDSFSRRAKGGGVTYLTQFGAPGVNATTFTLVAGTDYYFPFFFPGPRLLDQLAAQVDTTGTAVNMRMGIYAADRDWQPLGGPLIDSGNVGVGTTGVKTFSPSPLLYLPRGCYLTVFNADGTVILKTSLGPFPFDQAVDPTVLINQVGQLSVARAYAAFPTPGTPWTAVNGVAGKTNCLVCRFA